MTYGKSTTDRSHCPGAAERRCPPTRFRRQNRARADDGRPARRAPHAGGAARRRADNVVVTIFVNPAQFAPHEDLASYPRSFDADLARGRDRRPGLCAARGRHVPGRLFQPHRSRRSAVVGPEDRFRPQFFGGVATVVAKLLIQFQPDYAVFGEKKDYQQLGGDPPVARDLDLPVEIVGLPTIREPDGLALSSRNAYLSVSDRATAPVLYQVLETVRGGDRPGENLAQVLDEGGTAIETAGFMLDYLEARNADTLEQAATSADAPLRLLVAARIGKD